ncbi:hypothetical protein MTO96_009033 [Rhipicephalus appendiculatus]
MEQHHDRLAAAPARELCAFFIDVDPDEPTFSQERFQHVASILSNYMPDIVHRHASSQIGRNPCIFLKCLVELISSATNTSAPEAASRSNETDSVVPAQPLNRHPTWNGL